MNPSDDAHNSEISACSFRAVEAAFAVALRMLEKAPSFCLFGAGDTGDVLIELCARKGLRPLGVLDDLTPKTSCRGIPVLPLKEGLAQWRPDAVLLGTLKAADRMKRHLDMAGFSGRVLEIRDVNEHLRLENDIRVVSPRDQIRLFHDRHKGKRAFVIGNGPSLLKTDPRRLMEQSELTFASNNIYLIDGFVPSYYGAIDRVLTYERSNEINGLPWIKFFPYQVSEWIKNGIFLNSVPSEWPRDFSTDISRHIEIDFSVTYFLLQVAFYMGCNPVYLIGVDHTYVVAPEMHMQDGRIITSLEDDPNHFHPDYFGKGRRWISPPPMEKLEACYVRALEVYQENGRALFNATEGGALDKLPRAAFNALLSAS